MQFGDRLWVCPGEIFVAQDDAAIVRLDPGLAFGTGTHATTALCLEWLDSLDIKGKTMLDYGCGSGVLAIAALKLGADNAVATDIDRQAIQATQDNAARNDVHDSVTTTQNADEVPGQFDVVVANILAAPLIEFAETIAGHVKSGCLIALSGILSEQVGGVLTAYSPWIEFDEPVEREQGGQTWARLSGRRTED
jgi:ribosomal protein L11 methyltransferase